MNETQYPVSEKLNDIQRERAAITEFIGWLDSEQGILMAVLDELDGQMYPMNGRLDGLIMQFYGINPVELENERRAMLAALGGENDD